MAAVAAIATLSNSPARASEPTTTEEPEEPRLDASSSALPSVPGLEYRFYLDASWGNFGFINSLYTNPKPDQPSGNLGDHWFEGALKAGLSASYSSPAGQIYGKISAAGDGPMARLRPRSAKALRRFSWTTSTWDGAQGNFSKASGKMPSISRWGARLMSSDMDC